VICRPIERTLSFSRGDSQLGVGAFNRITHTHTLRLRGLGSLGTELRLAVDPRLVGLGHEEALVAVVDLPPSAEDEPASETDADLTDGTCATRQRWGNYE
jgi:hypothetical protein